MTMARNMARLLRGEAVDSGAGEILGYANALTAAVSAVGLLALGASLGWALFGSGCVALALFAMLANRTTLYIAAALATLTVGGTFAAIGWFLFGSTAAAVAGLCGTALAGFAYASIARRLAALPEGWY